MSVRPIDATRSAVVQQVAPEKTPATVSQIGAAIGRAYRQVTGQAPSERLLRTLTAQASLETGSGTAMYNFNFGGIKGAGPHGETARCLTHEVLSGQDQVVHQDFRAYRSLEEGAVDYVRVVVQRFGSALPAANAGDLAGFAHALKTAGYYTASESDYTAALTSVSGAAGKATSERDAPLLPVPKADSFATSLDLSRVLDALSASALRIAAPSSTES